MRDPERAKGYYRSESRFLLSDIDALELPDGRLVRFTFLQTGQEGLFASIADMSACDSRHPPNDVALLQAWLDRLHDASGNGRPQIGAVDENLP